MTQTPADAPGAALDRELRAWFDALVAEPAPEALLRYLEGLDSESPAGD